MDSHSENCCCHHYGTGIKAYKRWLINLAFIAAMFIIFKPFIIGQIINRGDGFLSHGMCRDAVRKYKMALFLDQKNSETWDWMGYAYQLMGKPDKAIEIYKKAVGIDPNNRVAWYDLGDIYMKRSDYGKAAEYFFNASLIHQSYKTGGLEDNYSYHRGSLKMLQDCYQKMGMINKAITVNRTIIRYYPKDKKARQKACELLNEYRINRNANSF